MTTGQAAGPAVPTPEAVAVLRPLGVGDVTITGGVLGRMQRTNREASMPLGLRQMEEAGSLPNLRLAAGKGSGAFTGYRFQDSDLYKQLEAAAWEHARQADPEAARFIAEAAGVLVRAQRPDGYLNSHYQLVKPDRIYAELEYSHEHYCAGHLFQAAVAAARAGADERLLAVAIRLADHLVEVFLRGGHPGLDGHAEVETALVELYRLTGTRAYLDLAVLFVDARGHGLVGDAGMGVHYSQDHLPVRRAGTAVGHAVRQLYLDAGVVDVYLETGDRSLLDCSVRRWEDTIATKTYITGGIGSRHSHESVGDGYELPSDRAYSETCASIAAVHWNWRLLLSTGHGRYADLIERILYNAFAAGTSADGTRFFYVNPLQRRKDHLEGNYQGRRREWFACACCPPNIMRLVSSLGHYIATTGADTLYVHQYAPGTLRARLPGGRVALTADTGYPWAGSIRFTVEESAAGHWTLALRVPGWSASVRVTVAGKRAEAAPDERGYLLLRREWRAGDTVELLVDMSPRLMRPHHRIDAVRGCAALERGPLVYCFEQADQAGDVELDDLALVPGTAIRVLPEEELKGVGHTVRIEVDAVVRSRPATAALPYDVGSATESATVTRVRATAIPYFQWDNRDGGPMRVWIPLT
ncbi:glycoside hydrolase family 127 protein [Sphaerisporangium flaviroseum]|uniref:Glycoside hydrolase family 127 protein n=1 Tax=Sphaerisporangium flaviroseum TaxID=509199 RepID=A0ABP7IWQ3_9ACTN